jgi:hypothetical protein
MFQSFLVRHLLDVNLIGGGTAGFWFISLHHYILYSLPFHLASFFHGKIKS